MVLATIAALPMFVFENPNSPGAATEVAAADAPVPSIPGSVVHMGDGSAEYTFEGVSAGEHRLIAVVADGIHVPLNPMVVDTVMFTVNN